MAFMTPSYYHGAMRYYPGAGENGDWVPRTYWDDEAVTGDEAFEQEAIGYFVELSASGYMDRTGWSGPFDTIEEARRHVIDQWEVDPDTGDDLPEDLSDEDVEAMVAGTYDADEGDE